MLAVGARGLTDAEAAARLARDGPNELPRAAARPVWRSLVDQLVHFFALMLWAAALLALAGGLPELAVAIALVVVFNAVFAFAQEHRAERAAEQLRQLLPRRATVVRDGRRRSIDAAELVVGDLVALAAGDRVSADLAVAQAHGLALDVSLLTGESVPVVPEPGEDAAAGTFVVAGEGLATVTATGAATRLAAIAALTQHTVRPPSPLTIELHRLVRQVATIAVAVGVGFFLVGLMLDTPPSQGLVFAVGVTVALVPEGLLPTVTLSLALGAQRMARHRALVRRLEAVETLGSTTFVWTDKTGTLTTNEMVVVEVWTPAGTVTVTGSGYVPTARVEGEDGARAAARAAAVVARGCATGRAVSRGDTWVAEGDPMEAAVDALAHRLGSSLDPVAAVARFPFDPSRRRVSVVTRDRVLVTGAPDGVLSRCRPGASTEAATTALASLTGRGLRVLAVATRSWSGRVAGGALAPDDVEADLEVLGLLGIEDPPRPTAREAVARCRAAGIRLGIVTGDHPATAAAIAREVGLARDGAPVVVGADLPADEQVLGALLDVDGVVVARVTPEDKLRIARAMRARGHVVAMTGDGVNDGPALQEADIGVAMGRSGTDVAREAADLVLLDDDFSTIVAAVEQGRATFANVQRFLTYHLCDNVAELAPFVVWALSAGTIPLPLTILQVLALDIGTDTLSAVALGAERPARHALQRPPVSGRLLDRVVALRAFAVAGPTEALAALAAFFATGWVAGWRPGASFPGGATLLAASGATYLTIVLAQSANAFACRSTLRPAWRGWWTNRLLLVAVAVELGFAVATLLVAPLADALRHAWPAAIGTLVALASVPLVFAVDAAWKWHRARAFRRAAQAASA